MLKLYNTISQKKQIFKSISDGKVGVYLCGPTVYNYIHIGNARPICVFDVLHRYLKKLGYCVKFVQNFTDIDDKIIRKAAEESLTVSQVSEKYIKEYMTDAKGLGVLDADIHPRVTENIGAIIIMIEELISKKFAYITENNDVYFRVGAFSEYGKLSHRNVEDLKVGARVSVNEMKESPIDFALWKHESDSNIGFESPWGIGRPGWHIECSVMIRKFLGNTIDIHCGGQDLIFPHHENEIAQSECANGTEFARFWLHNGFINVNKEKMSKSLGNFFTVREISEKFGYEPIRFLMISSHYRSPINFSVEALNQSKSALERLYECRRNIEFSLKNSDNNVNTESTGFGLQFDDFKRRFFEALDDDLNTADAIGVYFEFVKFINRDLKNFSRFQLVEILQQFDEFANVLGLLYNKTDRDLDFEVENLIRIRNEARKKKDWARADEIRKILTEKNIAIEDTNDGTKWRKI